MNIGHHMRLEAGIREACDGRPYNMQRLFWACANGELVSAELLRIEAAAWDRLESSNV